MCRLPTAKAPTQLGPGQYHGEAKSMAGEAQSTIRRYAIGSRDGSSRMASRPQTVRLSLRSMYPVVTEVVAFGEQTWQAMDQPVAFMNCQLFPAWSGLY